MRDFEVTVRCARGYGGKAVATECLEHDQPYSLSGCTAMECTTPDDMVNYEVTEHSLDMPSFSVTARCADSGATAKSIPCQRNGWPYRLYGCPQHCTSPNITAEYKVHLGS